MTPSQLVSHDSATPWYMKFIYAFGVPAALTVYLVWFLSNNVDTRLNKITNVLDAHSNEMALSLKASEEAKQQLYLTNLLLQRICVNTAADAQARNNCFGPTQ